MDRRSFLRTSALGGGAAAASTLAAPAYATGKRTLTMVQSWPRGFAVLDDAASYMVEMVGAMSDGQLTIDKKARHSVVMATTSQVDSARNNTALKITCNKNRNTKGLLIPPVK